MNTGTTIRTLTVMLLFGVQAVFAQTPAELFAKGNDDYRAGKYADAASQYEAIIGQGLVSAEVYFNLGNAYYRQGKIALAILSYERAQRLKPGDPDIAHNLRLVNLKTVDRIEPVPDLFIVQWMRAYAAVIPYPTAFGVLMVAWVVLFLALAGVYVVRNAAVVRALRWFVLVAVVLALLAGATIGIHSMLSLGDNQGIITTSVVTAKTSPDEQSMNAFVVHEGLKVNMGDTLGDWVKITLADGKVGWVHSQQCERI